MSKLSLLAAILFVLSTTTTVGHAETVYVWRDADGVTHYSDLCPPREDCKTRTLWTNSGWQQKATNLSLSTDSGSTSMSGTSTSSDGTVLSSGTGSSGSTTTISDGTTASGGTTTTSGGTEPASSETTTTSSGTTTTSSGTTTTSSGDTTTSSDTTIAQTSATTTSTGTTTTSSTSEGGLWGTIAGGSTACSAPPAPPTYDPGLSYDPPITITKGGTYNGRWRSTTLGQAVVTIATSEDVVIENSIIVGRGDLVRTTGSSIGVITIRNTQGFGLTRWASGEPAGKVFLDGVKGVIIENNYIEHIWGIDIRNFKGSGIGAETVKVRNNQFRNAESVASQSKGHSIILNRSNAANMEIAWNEIINEPFISRTEDPINVYMSGGVSGSPLWIHNNYIQGGYTGDPVSLPFYQGTGIIVDEASSWTLVRDNQVVATTNVGLGITGGHDIEFTNNRVISSGFLPDGRWVNGANALGLVVWDYFKDGKFYNNRMANNTVAVNRKDASGNIYQKNTWFPDCPSGCTGNTTYDPPIPTVEMEAAEYERWKNIVRTTCARIGVQ